MYQWKINFNPNPSNEAQEVIFLFGKIKEPNYSYLIFNNNQDLRYVFTTTLFVFS